MAKTDQTIVTGPLRCGYVNVFRPRVNDHNGKEEYSLQLIVPKDSEDAAKLRKAVDACMKATFPKGAPKSAWDPLRDAEEDFAEKDKPLPEYLKGMLTLNCKNVRRPGLIDKDKNDVLDETAFQSGDYARVHLNLFGYNKGSGGVSGSLQNVQVIRKGEPLGSMVRAEDAFDEWEDDGEDWAA